MTRLEKPYPAVVDGEYAHSAYWQMGDSATEFHLLCTLLDKHCRPLGMTINSDFSIGCSSRIGRGHF